MKKLDEFPSSCTAELTVSRISNNVILVEYSYINFVYLRDGPYKLYVNFAKRNSLLSRAICVTEIPFGHSASHA